MYSELMIVHMAKNTGMVVNIDPSEPIGLTPAFLYRAITSICFLRFIALLTSWAAYLAFILDTWNCTSCIFVCFFVDPNENRVAINLRPNTITKIPTSIPQIPHDGGNQP